MERCCIYCKWTDVEIAPFEPAAQGLLADSVPRRLARLLSRARQLWRCPALGHPDLPLPVKYAVQLRPQQHAE